MIPQSVVDDAARYGVNVVQVYGSSEAPFSTEDGAALAGVTVDIGDDSELLISGPHQFHGYLYPAHNYGAFDGDWVRTGDQAEIAGGRIRITGRIKEIVTRKGMKISLAEIDAAAAGLGDCAAFAVPDDETGERLALAVRAEVDYAGVVAHLTRGGLATWKLPEQIVWWQGEFPRTESGKIIRRETADTSPASAHVLRATPDEAVRASRLIRAPAGRSAHGSPASAAGCRAIRRRSAGWPRRSCAPRRAAARVACPAARRRKR